MCALLANGWLRATISANTFGCILEWEVIQIDPENGEVNRREHTECEGSLRNQKMPASRVSSCCQTEVEVIKKRDGRILVEISCWIEGPEGVHCVTTFDLSDAGVSVLSSDPLPEGRVVNLQFFTPFAAESVDIKAEVVWSRTGPDGGMGLRFLNMDKKSKMILMETALLLRTRDKASRRSRESGK